MKKRIFISLCLIALYALQASSFETKILPNGQTLIVEQIKNNPIVIIDTWVKTGSINEDKNNSGVSHFLEHLLFKGSKKYKTGEFDRLLETKGGIVNAATSKDFTHFYIEIPSKHFDLALDLHSDMLLNPLIPDDELKKERKVVIEEISKDLNNPHRKVYENFIENFYSSHPYKQNVIGKKEIISTISKQEILNYYNKYYIPENMITIVIGDIEPQYAFSQIEKKFNTPHKKLKQNYNKKEKKITKQTIKTDYQPINSGYIIIGYRTESISNKDNYALDILSTILASGRSSILCKNIKEKKQLAFSIDASNSTYKEDGMFLIDANFMPENLEKLQNAIYEEIEKIISNGITETELNLAKKIIETETKYSRESISNIASQIGYTTVLTDNTKYYNTYLKNINNVTKEDIQKIAKKYLKKENSVVSIVLPENTKLKNSETKNTSVSKPDSNALFIKESNNIKKYILDNKATVLINKNSSNDIIAMSIYAKGGKFIEDIPTVSNLTAATMTKGTKKYNKDELAQIMEENGIKISPQSTNDSFAVNIITTKSQLLTTMEILDEIVNNAVFDDNEIELAKRNKLNAITQNQDIPMNKALDSFKEMIYENSPYSNANKIFIKNYPKIQKKDIENYYKKIFAAENLVISINGNIEIDEIKNPLSEIFREKGTIFKYNKNLIPDLTTSKKSIKTQKNLSTAWLFTGWQTCGILNQKDSATLTVIDSLLGAGMSSRLFVDLREKEGLAYQVGSSFAPNLFKGSFMMYIGTNPKTLEKSKDLLFKEITRLKTIPVDEKELQEAKDKIIGRYVLSQETNLDKASQIGWFETSGRGFDFEKKYEELIYSVSSEDIIRVVKKYFTDNNILSIITNED